MEHPILNHKANHGPSNRVIGRQTGAEKGTGERMFGCARTSEEPTAALAIIYHRLLSWLESWRWAMIVIVIFHRSVLLAAAYRR